MTKLPSAFEDLRGQNFKEHIEIHELVAAAPREVVFGGHDTETEQDVILRLIHPPRPHDEATVERFERRITIARRVRHPAVIVPLDSGELLDGQFYVVSPRPGGQTLEALLDRLPSGRLPWQLAGPLMLQLAQGLGAVHARTLVHGALSPTCCWVDLETPPHPTLALLDTGSAIGPSVDEGDLGFSRTTVVGGNPLYVAPEAPGGRLGDERSDVYLLGLIAYTMLTGQPPFVGGNAFQVAMMHMKQAVTSLREQGLDVSEEVDAFVLALLDKVPERRPTSMDVVAQRLLELFPQADDHMVPPALNDGEPTRSQRRPGRRPRGRAGRAKAAGRASSSRAAAVERLGGPKHDSARPSMRRLPGQELLDPGPTPEQRGPAPKEYSVGKQPGFMPPGPATPEAPPKSPSHPVDAAPPRAQHPVPNPHAVVIAQKRVTDVSPAAPAAEHTRPPTPSPPSVTPPVQEKRTIAPSPLEVRGPTPQASAPDTTAPLGTIAAPQPSPTSPPQPERTIALSEEALSALRGETNDATMALDASEVGAAAPSGTPDATTVLPSQPLASKSESEAPLPRQHRRSDLHGTITVEPQANPVPLRHDAVPPGPVAPPIKARDLQAPNHGGTEVMSRGEVRSMLMNGSHASAPPPPIATPPNRMAPPDPTHRPGLSPHSPVSAPNSRKASGTWAWVLIVILATAGGIVVGLALRSG